jgi:hypothetical protein
MVEAAEDMAGAAQDLAGAAQDLQAAADILAESVGTSVVARMQAPGVSDLAAWDTILEPQLGWARAR